MAHLAANDVLEVREAMTKVTDLHTDRLLPYRKRAAHSNNKLAA